MEIRKLKRTGVALAATAAVSVAALGITGMADAGSKGQANTKLTIDGGGGLVQGEVKSPDENTCAKNRKVLIYQVKNGNSEKVATDRAQENGGRYQWGRGFDGGKYFAKVKQNSDCKGDQTETVSAGHL